MELQAKEWMLFVKYIIYKGPLYRTSISLGVVLNTALIQPSIQVLFSFCDMSPSFPFHRQLNPTQTNAAYEYAHV